MPIRTAMILSLADPACEAGVGEAGEAGADGCGACGASCLASSSASTEAGRACERAPRVPVLACKDALIAHGYDVELRTATTDPEVDKAISRLDGPPRPDGLTWPARAEVAGEAAASGDIPVLIVAVSSDAQLRHVLRRMVRRYTPPASKRPADLPDGRTVADLPPIGVLPMAPAAGLVEHLGLPRDPADVAKAVDGGLHRRIDLFRSDGGSITIHGALLGGVDAAGEVARWTGHVVVDDTVLASPSEPLLACAIANASGYAQLDEINLAPAADPSSGTIMAAVAVPIVVRSRFGRPSVRLEVRRASGRAVSVTPSADLPYMDDGVPGTLTRRRTWWIEASAWAAYVL